MPVSTKLQVRRDNAATWTSQNPILAAGEIGFETDNLRFKIGNGSNTWANLAYQAAVFNGGTITNTLVVSNTVGVNTSGQFISTIATGTAPFTVSSTTRVANLNVATSGTTSNVLGGATGGILYQSAANTTAFLAAPATNNSILAYNTATGAPEWDAPPLAMATLTGYTSTVTAAGATSLTNASSFYQQFTGTTTQTVILPNTATLITGWTFHIVNNSTGNVTANTFANAATLMVIPANTTAMVTCINTASNTATGWEIGLTDFGTYTGTGSVVMNTSPTISSPSITTNLTTTSTSFDLINANATTINFGGAATTLNIGNTFSAQTVNMFPSSTGASTYNFATGAQGSGTTKTLNIGTGAGTGGTTNINIGGNPAVSTSNITLNGNTTLTPANAVAATSATTAGYVGMPQNSQSGAYTLAAGDAGKHIYYTTTGQTVTIPNNSSVAFQIGTAITFITAPSVSLSIAITTDTLRLANTTTTGTRTLAANGVATAIKVTSTAWIISGNGLT
jgi:hypothetical protein